LGISKVYILSERLDEENFTQRQGRWQVSLDKM
jgi:hypothetical protein